MDETLAEWLEVQARNENRSVSNWVETRLERLRTEQEGGQQRLALDSGELS